MSLTPGCINLQFIPHVQFPMETKARSGRGEENQGAQVSLLPALRAAAAWGPCQEQQLSEGLGGDPWVLQGSRRSPRYLISCVCLSTGRPQGRRLRRQSQSWASRAHSSQ